MKLKPLVKRARSRDGGYSMTMSRVIVWVAQAALGALFFFVNTSLQEVKIQVASLSATMAARDAQFAKVETKSVIVDENVKEIRQDIKLINSAIQDLRVLAQRPK